MIVLPTNTMMATLPQQTICDPLIFTEKKRQKRLKTAHFSTFFLSVISNLSHATVMLVTRSTEDILDAMRVAEKNAF